MFEFHLFPFRRNLYGASFTIGCRAAHSRIHAFADNDFAVVTRSAVFTPTIFSAFLSGQIADGIINRFATVYLIVPFGVRLTEFVCACVGLLRIHRSREEQKCEEYRYNEKGPQGGRHAYIITVRPAFGGSHCGRDPGREAARRGRMSQSDMRRVMHAPAGAGQNTVY